MSDYVKRSANEKVFDAKGFKSKKRTPMYNQKYIERAKKNVEDKYFDDKYDDVKNPYYEYDELEQYNLSNRKMYQDMQDMKETKQNLNNKYRKSDKYPRIREIDSTNRKEEESLRKEIKEIKKLLEETQEKMSNYKCPVQPTKNFENKSDSQSFQTPATKAESSLMQKGNDPLCYYDEESQSEQCKN
jgi:hypothetical protein